MSTIEGTAGNDDLVGTSGNDTFNLSQGGDDTVDGEAGNDTIDFGAALTAADTIDGGSGSDTVVLSGNYSALLTFGATTMVNVEEIVFRAGNSYKLATADQTVAAGQSLLVNASQLGAGDALTFDGRAETDGKFHFIGGAGNDHLVGSAGNDLFDLTEGGNDFVEGGKGNDTILLGSTFTASDQIQGGAGNDTVDLTSTAGTIAFTATTMLGIENVVITGAHNYDLTLNAATLSPGASMTFDAAAMTGGFHLDASAVGSGDLAVMGGSGDDAVVFGAALSAGDSVAGGAGGNDKIYLDGDYSAGLTLTSASALTQIGELLLQGNFTYDLDLGNSSIVEINGKATAQIDIDGSHMTGAVQVDGGAGDNTFTTDNAGSEFVGGAGDDTLIVVPGTASSDGIFKGGDGFNTLVLYAPFTLDNSTDVQEVILEPGIGTYTIAENADLGKEEDSLQIVDAHLLGPSDSVYVYGANGRGVAVAIGGAGDDVLTGGVLTGGGGADGLIGNTEHISGGEDIPEGGNTFIYNAVSDSTSTAYDSIAFFVGTTTDSTVADVFKLWFTVTAVDTSVTTGSLSTATFDADLAAAVGASQLGADHAVVFTPDSGTLHGDHFLVIDANGVAGYQAGQDLVIQIDSNSSLTTANFTT